MRFFVSSVLQGPFKRRAASISQLRVFSSVVGPLPLRMQPKQRSRTPRLHLPPPRHAHVSPAKEISVEHYFCSRAWHRCRLSADCMPRLRGASRARARDKRPVRVARRNLWRVGACSFIASLSRLDTCIAPPSQPLLLSLVAKPTTSVLCWRGLS